MEILLGQVYQLLDKAIKPYIKRLIKKKTHFIPAIGTDNLRHKFFNYVRNRFAIV